jgi:hypothetical protein
VTLFPRNGDKRTSQGGSVTYNPRLFEENEYDPYRSKVIKMINTAFEIIELYCVEFRIPCRVNVGDKDPCVNTMLICTEPPTLFGDVKEDGSAVALKVTLTSPAYPAGITLGG